MTDDPAPRALPDASPREPRRYDGRKVALAFGALIVIGTLVATAAALYGHRVGAVARERFEAARAHHD